MFVISNIMGSRNLLYIFPFSFIKAHQYKSVELFDTVIVQSTENASFQNKFKILAFLHAKIYTKSTTLIAFGTSAIVSLSVRLREKEKKEEKTFVFRRLYFEKKKTPKKGETFSKKNYMNI